MNVLHDHDIVRYEIIIVTSNELTLFRIVNFSRNNFEYWQTKITLKC